MSSTRTTRVVVTKDSPTMNKQRRRNQKRRQNRALKKTGTNVGPRISKCSLDYARCLVNPFGVQGLTPCIPDVVTLPSYKFSTKCRGVFSTGVQGTGYVAFDPWKMAWNDGATSVGNSSCAVFYTTTLYDQPDVDFTFPLSAGIQSANPNSMFEFTFFQGPRQYRLVAAGARIRYVGSDFRNQGRTILYRNQGCNNITTPITNATLLADNFTAVTSVQKKWLAVHYQPDNPSFFAYTTSGNYDAGSGGSDHRHILIFVDGADTEVPQSWEFECISYFEAIGSNVPLSVSHADPVGMGAVSAAANARISTLAPGKQEEGFLARVYQALKETSSGMAIEATRQIPRIAMNYLSSQAGFSHLSLPTVEDVD